MWITDQNKNFKKTTMATNQQPFFVAASIVCFVQQAQQLKINQV